MSVDCHPAGEARLESWRPNMTTLQVERHLPPWDKRPHLVDPMIDDSMCAIRAGAAKDARARSLALIRPAEILGFRLERHPGWTEDKQAKIDTYVDQLEFDIFDDAAEDTARSASLQGLLQVAVRRSELPGPRAVHHRLGVRRPAAPSQGLLGSRGSGRHPPALLRGDLRPDKDVTFFVGNQAKRPQTFSILGVYYPKRMS